MQYITYIANAIVRRLPHPPSRDSQGQETFSAPSADNQTRIYIHTYCYLKIKKDLSPNFAKLI